MKQSNCIHAGVLVVLCNSMFLYSCDTNNFSRPQPADKANIYEFPETFQGSWIDKDDHQYVFIARQYVSIVTEGTERIMNGAWPQLDANGGYLYPPSSFNSIMTIRYDSLKRPIDTIINYVRRGKHIYEVRNDGSLENGFPCDVRNDTISVIKNDTLRIDLGRNAFLRKAGNDFYVLNVINSIMGEENRWWQIVILEKRNDQSINIWTPTSKLADQPSMFYHHGHNYYFDSRWTSAEIMRLIHNGSFKPDSRLWRVKKAASAK